MNLLQIFSFDIRKIALRITQGEWERKKRGRNDAEIERKSENYERKESDTDRQMREKKREKKTEKEKENPYSQCSTCKTKQKKNDMNKWWWWKSREKEEEEQVKMRTSWIVWISNVSKWIFVFERKEKRSCGLFWFSFKASTHQKNLRCA